MLEATVVAVTVELAKLTVKKISTSLIGESGQWRRITEVDKAFYEIFPRDSRIVLVLSGYDARLKDFDYDDRSTGIKDAIALMSLSDYLGKAKVAVSVYDHAVAKPDQKLLQENLIVTGSPPFNSIAELILERCVPSGKVDFEFAKSTILFDGEPKIDREDTVRGVIACARNSIAQESAPSKRALLFAGVHQLGTHLAISYFINREVQRAMRPLVTRKVNLNWAVLVRGTRRELDIQDPVAERVTYW